MENGKIREMLDVDYQYFLDNVSRLYEKYGDKMVAIRDKQILGIFDTADEAVKSLAPQYGLGTFIVQRCAKDADALVAHFAGNIIC